MYWPLGAPRIFAGPPRPKRSRDDDNQASPQDDADEEPLRDKTLIGLRTSRNGQVFATITATTLDIWQTSPVVLITSAERSRASLKNYGHNVIVLLRPDCSIAAVQTSLGFLVTYNITFDQHSRVYQLIRKDEKGQRQSSNSAAQIPAEEARYGQREIHIRFRMVIKVDAGISAAIALDDELVVATEKPAAVQCIRWTPDSSSNQTTTELLNRLPWMGEKSAVLDMMHDRAMSLFVWISTDGRAYAVQKIVKESQRVEGQGKIFRGYEFHAASEKRSPAVKAAINARFSLLAIGCGNGEILVYSARDYAGSLPLSHKLQPPASFSTTGSITFLSYSPDGYCLFVGYEKGWVLWSVYGKLGGHSFTADRAISEENDEQWLLRTHDGSWLAAGSELIFITSKDDSIWSLEFAKSAVTGCFAPANVSRTLLHTSSELMIYNGHDVRDILSVASDDLLWTHVPIPPLFLINQRPLRCAVISPDGRYIAIAGRRGLAHYSVQSGRWKTFDDLEAESSFMIRGGMCWYQHILIAAVDTGEHDELRLYSRESPLTPSSLLRSEPLPSPAVFISLSGSGDSLLVYTYENSLYHYIINMTSSSSSTTSIGLVRVGQIGLHGIVRAPARVRAVTWWVPDEQLIDGDPSQDVAHASVIFLVDAKLVLMQPTADANGTLKYDMRIIANDVEYFSFSRDQPHPLPPSSPPHIHGHSSQGSGGARASGLEDSLWYFDGQKVRCWPDVLEVLRAAAGEGNRELPEPVSIPVDFYPASVVMDSGVVLGMESEIVQRRDVGFAWWRYGIRTQLFLPPLLRHYLSLSDRASALRLAQSYQYLSYFPHALELLLHNVLDDAVDSIASTSFPSPSSSPIPTPLSASSRQQQQQQPSTPPQSQAAPTPTESLLAETLSLLSSFPAHNLDIIVQCARKSELSSWSTLFRTLPPPAALFDEALARGMLKTAASYLIVIYSFEGERSGSKGEQSGPDGEQSVRLLQRALEEGEEELCEEVVRFLRAMDESGDVLKGVMAGLGVELPDADVDADEGEDGSEGEEPLTARRVRPRGEVFEVGELARSPAGSESGGDGNEGGDGDGNEG